MEKKGSSEDYVLTDGIFRVESTKEGIQVFDENGTFIGEQKVNETTVLFEMKNHLIK